MERRSTLPSGIGMALQQHGDNTEASNTVEAGEEKRLPPRGGHDRSMSEARMFAQPDLGDDSTAEKTLAIDVNGTEVSNSPTASPTKTSLFNDFCRGQPPKRSFLGPDGRTPPRLRMSRRSTLADKPELDTLLKAVMIQYKDGEFLPLDTNTVHRLTQYLNGSKPLAHTCRFKRLLINSETNKVRAGLFVAALENIGVYCEHLVIVAPFHTIEFSNVFDRETGNAEPGSDWEKILECFPNLRTLTFEHPVKEPTNLTRDTFYSLNRALANNTTLQRFVDVQFDVPPKLMFDYHHDYHSRQRQSSSPHSFSVISTPLTMVGSDMVYADGAEDFGSLDAEPVFGKADDIDTVDD
ncbi:hypothetical protein BU25DRAFT_196758 [Macroventuria anomochaeta]|uniref:Uncharacterized protein n=1 Tax=Macroventuria anomochaeta TaxID=301207 RepID=A0ACB6SET7_9PLEO|nr:uncharacterized protein BU25DRAFT_196758 [Macroventuria anomochaeta]KAF2631779.1 hypothetical protein BU25DRAFT_196758 [Macroventuria anomochaeta]